PDLRITVSHSADNIPVVFPTPQNPGSCFGWKPEESDGPRSAPRAFQIPEPVNHELAAAGTGRYGCGLVSGGDRALVGQGCRCGGEGGGAVEEGLAAELGGDWPASRVARRARA